MRTILTLTLATLLLTACQMPGKPIATEASPTCPKCKTITRTAMIEGLTVKDHRCPDCETLWTPGEEEHPGEKHHVCETCDSVVASCPQCRTQ